jgi:hypothetical protein
MSRTETFRHDPARNQSCLLKRLGISQRRVLRVPAVFRKPFVQTKKAGKETFSGSSEFNLLFRIQLETEAQPHHEVKYAANGNTCGISELITPVACALKIISEHGVRSRNVGLPMFLQEVQLTQNSHNLHIGVTGAHDLGWRVSRTRQKCSRSRQEERNEVHTHCMGDDYSLRGRGFGLRPVD